MRDFWGKIQTRTLNRDNLLWSKTWKVMKTVKGKRFYVDNYKYVSTYYYSSAGVCALCLDFIYHPVTLNFERINVGYLDDT